MIARLKGIVAEKSKEQVIVDVQGVGYGLMVPEKILFRIPEMGAPVTLQVYTHVREDALLLFGFLTTLEKEVFEILISASGVGPKLAMSILSAMDALEILESIANGNKIALNGISGVGKKTAERLVLELREKCEKRMLLERGYSAVSTGKGKSSAMMGGAAMGAGASESAGSAAMVGAGSQNWLRDLEGALLGLGYRDSDVRMVMREVMQELKDASFEPALKLALQKMASSQNKTIRGNA